MSINFVGVLSGLILGAIKWSQNFTRDQVVPYEEN